MLELGPRRNGVCGLAVAALLLILLLAAGRPAQAVPVRWELAGVVRASSGFDFEGLAFEGTLLFDPDAAPVATTSEEASWHFSVPPAAFELRVDGQRFAMASGRSFEAIVGDDFIPEESPIHPEPEPRDAISFRTLEDGATTYPYFNFGLRGADLDFLDAPVLPATPPDLADAELAQILYGETPLGFGDGTIFFEGKVTSLQAVALPEPRAWLLLAAAGAVAAGGVRVRSRAPRTAERSTPRAPSSAGPRRGNLEGAMRELRVIAHE